MIIREFLGNETAGRDTEKKTWRDEYNAFLARERAWQANALRDIFGNVFKPIAWETAWCTSTVIALAKQMYDARDFGAMPILADALQDAGCEDAATLEHCRNPEGNHVRGCWVVDQILGKK